MEEEPSCHVLRDLGRNQLLDGRTRLEGIRLRTWNPIPRFCGSDCCQHVPPPRQPTTDFGSAADDVHYILDSAAVLHLARSQPALGT